jgi:predicted ABC-type ATPase
MPKGDERLDALFIESFKRSSQENEVSILDRRPVIVVVAGPNGAGKTTFYHTHLQSAALRFVNADVLARELDLDPYAAARVADKIRRQLVQEGESFAFETVFSDPAGEKLMFLKEAAAAGYTVVLCLIGISSPEISEQRVAMRVTQGGHDVPTAKLVARFPRTLANLKTAIRTLAHVFIFDNDDLHMPFRQIAIFENGQPKNLIKPTPPWLGRLLRI